MVVLLVLVEASVDAEGLAVVLDLLSQDCYPRWGVAPAEHDLVLHDAKDFLVSDLSEILDSHEAGAECWQQNAEAGDELVGGLEVLEP